MVIFGIPNLLLLRPKPWKKNIVHVAPGPAGPAKHAKLPNECFSAFITPAMISVILDNTNKEIERQRAKFNVRQSFLNDVGIDELLALLGLLVMSGGLRDNHLKTETMWDTTRSGDRYQALMTRPRFEFLVNCIRFDDKLTREERAKKDKLAPIS